MSVNRRKGREADELRLWLRLLSCTTLIERRIGDGLRDNFGSSLARFDVLAQLANARRDGARHLSMSELSRRLMVTNGNVTGLIGRLEAEGLVRRSRDPSDGRSHLVELTGPGRTAFARMARRHREWIDELFASLGEGHRSQLFSLLGTLKSSVESGGTNGRRSRRQRVTSSQLA
jgi:DNA-binding MarR family transcriptional regulator